MKSVLAHKGTLASIILRTKKKLFRLLYGEHESIFGGRGFAFREVRAYSHEDDVRHINWKITAKANAPMLNLYNETKQIPVLLVYLNSGGLIFGDKKSKKQTAIEVLTSLSYVTLSRHDTLTTLFYASEQLQWMTSGRHQSITEVNFSTANTLDPLGNSIDFNQLSSEIMQKTRRKSLIFLIGDFWDFSENSDLGKLAFFHELYCIVVRDRGEEILTLRGDYEITDPLAQTSHTLHIGREDAARYHALAEAHEKMLQAHFSRHHIASIKIYTDEDAIEKLAQFVRR